MTPSTSANVIQALAEVSRIEKLVRASEESRTVQLRCGLVLPAHTAKLVRLRRLLAGAHLLASRQALALGLEELAALYARFAAEQERSATLLELDLEAPELAASWRQERSEPVTLSEGSEP